MQSENRLKIVRADTLGLCFGVRNALAVARELPDPAAVTIHGELVHNDDVQKELGRRGFRSTDEGERRDLPPTRDVLVTAHGISERERRRLLAAEKRLVDTTCPLVRHAHESAVELGRRGYFVIVIGRHGHVEVEGLTGDLERFAVVQTVADVRTFPGPRLGIVCQTTTPPDVADRLRRVIEVRNPGKPIRFLDTVCRPTRERQDAVLAILPRIEALVVVGGRHSNNTRQLAGLARRHGVPAFLVRGPADLDPAALARFTTVGLTAGASTPDAAIEAVADALGRIRPTRPG